MMHLLFIGMLATLMQKQLSVLRNNPMNPVQYCLPWLRISHGGKIGSARVVLKPYPHAAEAKKSAPGNFQDDNNPLLLRSATRCSHFQV